MLVIKLALLVLTLACCEGTLYSSFWAPLFNPRIVNFRVDATFDPDAGRKAREQYVENYGVRGETLIEDLGNGKRPNDVTLGDKGVRDVRFYYTYPGADSQGQQAD